MAKPKFQGSVLFDSKLTITIKDEQYILWINDAFNSRISKAEKGREMIVLKDPYVQYGEAMTGYIEEHEGGKFSFKHCPDSWLCTVIPYDDVIAWGYVDQAEFKKDQDDR